ncbi:MAG: hypothetical protein A07HB70_01537 [uncultured archaeon A07HB70]|jgi:hypothetical protein|nr:MAG: hypothetical protein A07HB70_01537 [uncultured archaeon A07HB70]
MNWQRERDGLVVVGVVLVVLVVAATGRGVGMVATFVATFLGVVAALRVESAFGAEPSDDVHRERPAAASSTGVDEPSAAEPPNRGDPEEPVD